MTEDIINKETGKLICSICKFDVEPLVKEGRVIWDQGNNAWPVNDGRCCNICNDSIVTPARIIQMARRENEGLY
jgi:hypothetical protein